MGLRDRSRDFTASSVMLNFQTQDVVFLVEMYSYFFPSQVYHNEPWGGGEKDVA